MVDVTAKDATTRIAVAAGALHTTTDVVEMIAAGGLPKGDALGDRTSRRRSWRPSAPAT